MASVEGNTTGFTLDPRKMWKRSHWPEQRHRGDGGTQKRGCVRVDDGERGGRLSVSDEGTCLGLGGAVGGGHLVVVRDPVVAVVVAFESGSLGGFPVFVVVDDAVFGVSGSFSVSQQRMSYLSLTPSMSSSVVCESLLAPADESEPPAAVVAGRPRASGFQQ